MRLHIDSRATVILTNRLEKVGKSALPKAVCKTLNDTALHVKKESMPEMARAVFEERDRQFFKANSKVNFAKGQQIKTMVAAVGFYENKLVNQGSNFAVADLEQQEHGGVIEGKSFIPLRSARVGGKGKVRANARMAMLNGRIINAMKVRSVSSRNKKQRFIRAAIKARELYGDNAYVLGNMKNGKQTLSRIDELWTGTRSRFQSFGSRKFRYKRTALYTVKKDRSIAVAATNFMKRASFESANEMNRFYTQNAETILKQVWK